MRCAVAGVLVKKEIVQLSNLVDSSKPKNIIAEVKKIFSFHYTERHFSRISKAATLAINLFEGRFPGYQSCNTVYHDLEHTMAALLGVARLLDGYLIRGRTLSEPLVINLFIATLLHDCGYIQESWDTEGTGAKHTDSHVERSVRFVEKNHEAFGIAAGDAPVIGSLIRSTGLSVNMDDIPFRSPEERVAGALLGTADLLGQMSDRKYLEKLLFLYQEFREAGIAGFNTEFDIIRKTVDFYEMTKKRMNESYGGLYKYARCHFQKRNGIDENLYLVAINRHIDYLHRIIDDSSTNFRKKLKRADWVNHAHSFARH